ncbi:MAG: hypothetical protein RR588_00455 [Solibacillus sp.]
MQIEGVNSIPSLYLQRVATNQWPYVVAKEFGLDPHVVMSWDNDSILEALASLKWMGVFK